MNCLVIDWVSGGATLGYVAVILCKSAHVDRPSSSTSGGQSDKVAAGALVAGAGTVESLEGAFVDAFIIDIHAAVEVHVRHLED